jgi:hypothetical protein
MLKEAEDFGLLAKTVLVNEQSRRATSGGFLTTACLSALEYTAAHEGVIFTPQQKQSVLAFLELGKAINNHYDQRGNKDGYYQTLRKQIENSGLNGYEFVDFYSQLRDIERHRPDPWNEQEPIPDSVRRYRETTNAVHLSAAIVSMGGMSMRELITPTHDFKEDAPSWVIGMYNYVMAMQVVDDKFGWKADLSKRRPSFFTGYCPPAVLQMQPDQIPDDVVENITEQMNSEFRHYMGQAITASRDTTALRTAVNVFNSISEPRVLGGFFRFQQRASLNLVNESDLCK